MTRAALQHIARLVTTLGASVCLLATSALAQGGSPTSARAAAVQELAQRYYAWLLTHPGLTLPNAQERTELAQFLTPGLVALLAGAEVAEERCTKAAVAGEKPFVLEGSLLLGNYEGATEVAYGSLTLNGQTARLVTELVYVDERFAKAHRHRAVTWREQMELRQGQEGWRIHDVHWDAKRSLLTTLRNYLAQAGRNCKQK